MDKKESNNLNSANSTKQDNKDLKVISCKINFKRFKIKPRNIFNNNKLFAYQKASGNITLLKKLIHQVFVNKYYHDKNFYNAKVIGDIINNESTHLVAEFKDYLIFGDDSEFLQKNYNIKDCKKYLPRILSYYESCSIIFPNYVVLHESKYIYKNIQKKQRVIDLQQDQEEKLKKIKSGSNGKQNNKEKNEEYNLFNTNIIYSILGQTNTSNINKIFEMSNRDDNKNKKEDENSEAIFNNIINEFEKVEEKYCIKTKLNLMKKNCRMQSLILNNSKSILKQCDFQTNEKEQANNDKENNNKSYKKKTRIIIKKQKNKYLKNMEKNNSNIKYLFIHKKHSSKIDADKNTLNNSKKMKDQTNAKEKQVFLTNENTSTNIFSKIPKSKLSIDLGGARKHHKIKTTLNEQEIFNQKGISFFKDILSKKKLRRKNTKNNSSMKSSSKTKKKLNSFIPSQKKLLQIMKKDKDVFVYKSMMKNNEKKLGKIKNKKNKISNISKSKVPIIYIKDSNSTSNIMKNNINLTTNRINSIIRKRLRKKGSVCERENDNNYNENLTNNKELTSESSINININTIPITDREKDSKKIFFTIAPQINNTINLNKIKYLIKNSSKENVVKGSNKKINSYKNYKYSKNTYNKKNIIFNKKNTYNNKNTYKSKKKSFSYKNSNTQISSSLVTAACSFGKNSHLIDFETIKVYSKRKLPYPILFKAKSINETNKNKYENNTSERKLSLSPDKIECKNIIKNMLINNSICYCSNCNRCNKNNFLNKIASKNTQNKKQKNKILPIRKEKDSIDIKIKDIINSVLNNKNMSCTLGNISRNLKVKHPNNDKNSIALTNRSNNSISTNGSIKKSLLSIKALKNPNSNNKNKNTCHCNKTYYH